MGPTSSQISGPRESGMIFQVEEVSFGGGQFYGRDKFRLLAIEWQWKISKFNAAPIWWWRDDWWTTKILNPDIEWHGVSRSHVIFHDPEKAPDFGQFGLDDDFFPWIIGRGYVHFGHVVGMFSAQDHSCVGGFKSPGSNILERDAQADDWPKKKVKSGTGKSPIYQIDTDYHWLVVGHQPDNDCRFSWQTLDDFLTLSPNFGTSGISPKPSSVEVDHTSSGGGEGSEIKTGEV